METFFTYFIKVSVLVSLFYLSYHFLLKRETFFNKNRLFLLLGLLTSLFLPLVTITKTIWIEPQSIVYNEPVFIPFQDFHPEIITNQIIETPKKTEINWSYLVAGFYVLGIFFFLIKFILSSLSLYKILHKTPIKNQNGYKFIDNKNVKTPFSFFSYIAFDSSAFSEEELQNIITHEKVHSKQKHSLDVILSEIFSIVFWINPFVWLYKKAIQQNLEFIADNNAIKTSENKIGYQKTLLKVTLNPKELVLANSFYQPLIKKRIMMLNKNKSRKINQLKYILLLPVLVLFVIQFQTKVVAQTKENKPNSSKKEKSDSFKKDKNEDFILPDTIIWVTDFSEEYEKQEWTNNFEKGYTEHFMGNATKENAPLVIVNGKEQENTYYPKDLKIEIIGKGTFKKYEEKEAVKKFGEKAKNGAYIIDAEKFTIIPIYKSGSWGDVEKFLREETSNPKTEKELLSFLKSVKDFKEVSIFNRYGVLVYHHKSNEKVDEEKINALPEGTYYYSLKPSKGKDESGYLQKGDSKSQKNSEVSISDYSSEIQILSKEIQQKHDQLKSLKVDSKEYEKTINEINELSDKIHDKSMILHDKAMVEHDKAMILHNKAMEEHNETMERHRLMQEKERQAQEKSNISNLSKEERVQKIKERKAVIEKRKKELEERRSVKQSEYNVSNSYRKNDNSSFSIIIDKNTSDKKIQEYIAQFKSQNIQMKVSNIKRNKNGKITKIKISVSESSGTKDNKKESKAEATFDKNESIPNIFVGKRNGSLIVSSNSK